MQMHIFSSGSSNLSRLLILCLTIAANIQQVFLTVLGITAPCKFTIKGSSKNNYHDETQPILQ